MKKLLTVAAIVPVIAACESTGQIEIDVSQKEKEWHVEVGIAAPLAKRDDLLSQARSTALEICKDLEGPDKVAAGTWIAIGEATLKVLTPKARWSAPCSAFKK